MECMCLRTRSSGSAQLSVSSRSSEHSRLTGSSQLSGLSRLSDLPRRASERLFVYTITLLVVLALLNDVRWVSALDWQSASTPDRTVYPDELRIFNGTQDGTEGDSFRVVLIDGDYMLIGSKNKLYQVHLAASEGLPITRTIIWEPTDRNKCLNVIGKDQDQCHNYIRVISRKSDEDILVCGTNAYTPWCRTYRQREAGFEHILDETGIGQCPFDHTHNNTAVYADGRLFSGTVADLSSRDALIYRKPMRTEQHDSQWLNEPNYVMSFEYGDKVYFLLREQAIEYINCGKSVYSRVARVCKNDQGGFLVLRNTWTSFFKTRLNCSIPGDFPFYFDEIQSSSALGKGNYRSTLTVSDSHDMIYAVFNTPSNSIRGSAVCAFKMADIVESFEGAFKEQKTAHSNWLPVKPSDTPVPHPAKQCHNNTKQISDSTLTFIKNHPLMDQSVQAFGGRPIFIQADFSSRMTQIAVDWQYRAVDGRRYDILYIGTDDGRVLKVVNKNRSDKIETKLIEEIVVFKDRSRVVKLELYRRQSHSTPLEHLVVVSDNEIRALPLHRCHLQQSCGACVGLQDPYCSWDVDQSRCINLIGPDDMDTRDFFQSIETGKHSQCQDATTTHSTIRETKSTELSSSTTESTTPPPPTCPPCPTQTPENTPPGSGANTNNPLSTPDESRLTPPLREQTTDFSNEIPVIPRDPKDPNTGASIGDPGKCSAEKFVIAVIVPSIIFSVIGFFAGFFVSRRYCQPEMKRNNQFDESNYKKAENTYSQDPANTFVTSPPFPQHGGKVKIFHNATTPGKQCNLKVRNGSVEAIVEPHKDNKVYV